MFSSALLPVRASMKIQQTVVSSGFSKGNSFSCRYQPNFLSVNYIDIHQAQVLVYPVLFSWTPFSSLSTAGEKSDLLVVQQERCMQNC